MIINYVHDNLTLHQKKLDKPSKLHIGDKRGKTKAVLRRLDRIFEHVDLKRHELKEAFAKRIKINPNSEMQVMIAKAAGLIPSG